RGSLYIGSDFKFTTDVTTIVEKPDTGNEYIYGTGAVLTAQARNKFYWGRRYAAQVVVRPVPTSAWPNKYADFGVPELKYNAGTGEGFSEILGWVGADGSAPGVVADLWIEFRWFAIAVMAIIGRIYGTVWRKAIIDGRGWTAQY